MTDKEILVQLRLGNEHCLKYLYQHLEMVKSWVKQNNGNDDDAYDVFQEAIIVFYKNLMKGNYESKSKISTYLFGICKRQWLNQLNRRLKYEKPNDNFVALDTRQDDGFEIEFTRGRQSLKRYIDEALNKLGEPCKKLLETTIYLKLRMQEIAEMFNYSSAHSARQQKLRCIKRLREQMSYELIIQLK